VHLVDDEHAAAQLERRVLRVFDEVAHVVDAVVARGVDFGDVGGAFRCCDQARFALAAGFAVFRREAVDCARKDACRCGLARAARAAKQIGVRRTIRRHLVFQSCGDVLLPDDVRKADRAILTVERAVSHGSFSCCLFTCYYTINRLCAKERR